MGQIDLCFRFIYLVGPKEFSPDPTEESSSRLLFVHLFIFLFISLSFVSFISVDGIFYFYYFKIRKGESLWA